MVMVYSSYEGRALKWSRTRKEMAAAEPAVSSIYWTELRGIMGLPLPPSNRIIATPTKY